MKRIQNPILVLTGCAFLALASACDDTSCLEESTLISTPDGLRAIGELEAADSVESVDPFTGAKLVNRVARVVTAWAWCEKLVIGGNAVWLTAKHPLYSPELGEFRPAEAWLSGELSQTLSVTGTTLSASAGGWLDQRPCRVIDLSVARDPHTFVAAGIVVHNKSLASPPCQLDEDCPDGFVCDPVEFCVPATGTGGASGSGGAGGEGGASGMGGGG